MDNMLDTAYIYGLRADLVYCWGGVGRIITALVAKRLIVFQKVAKH